MHIYDKPAFLRLFDFATRYLTSFDYIDDLQIKIISFE